MSERTPQRIALIGPPNIGKGTLGRQLCDCLGIQRFGMSDALRAHVQALRKVGSVGALQRATIIDNIMKASDLVPCGIVKDVLIENQGVLRDKFLLDGVPRTRAQAEGMANIPHFGRRPDIFFIHMCGLNRRELALRAARRLGQENRSDDCPRQFNKRYDDYLVHQKPLSRFIRYSQERLHWHYYDLTVHKDDTEEMVLRKALHLLHVDQVVVA